MAIDFTGAAGAGVNIGNGSSLQITGACCVMCWVNFDTDLQNVDILNKYVSGANGFTLQTDKDTVDMWGIFLIAETATTMKNSGWTAIPLQPGTWYHLAGQFIPSTAVQIWLNGVLSKEKTTSIPATMHDPANDVWIGNRSDGSQGINGKIDDVRIYDKEKTDAEIQSIYAGGGVIADIDGLVFSSLMNEGSHGISVSGANSVIDRGPYGHHGTSFGSNTYHASELRWR